jgi:uncharacterized protein (TIGR02284 family)
MQRQRNLEASPKHKAAEKAARAKVPHQASTNVELAGVLRDLAATCRDAEEGFNKAAKGAHSDELRSLFGDYSRQRELYASELDGLVKRYGGAPGETGHGSGPLRRGWKDLEASIRPKADPEFMLEVADGEESGLKHYDHALALELPDEVRQLLEKQRQAMQRAVAQFRAGAGTKA